MTFITENGLIFYVTPNKKIALPNTRFAVKAVVCKNRQDVEDLLIGMYNFRPDAAEEAIEGILYSVMCNHPLCMGDADALKKHFAPFV